MAKYFHELTIEEMFEQHDYTYQMSDDQRWYEQGRLQYQAINDKIDELGGWNKELIDKWNKYAPGDKPWEKEINFPNMTWKRKYSDYIDESNN